MDLPKEISAAEDRFREKLELYLRGIFRDTVLSSHGPEHHQRVWLNAKDLMLFPGIASSLADTTLPMKLIIGCYLHDSGMVEEKGPRHGAVSRRYTEDFLTLNGMNPLDFDDLLAAVENHDNKEYTSAVLRSALPGILTVADDIDALGFTGIYRYLEIYLVRGIPLSSAGLKIAANVKGRFQNLEKTFSDIPAVATRYRPKLEIITAFFEKYNIQAKSYLFDTGHPSGYCGVAEIIGEMLKNNSGLEETIDDAIILPDRVISWYFGELRRELG